MNTFIKVCLVIILAAVAVHVLPLVAGPLGVVLVAGLLLLAGALGVCALLLGIAAGVLLLTSPLWLPVLAVAGIIGLVCRRSRTPVAAPAAAA